MGYRILFKQCGSDHMTRGRQGRSIDGIAIHYTGSLASARNNATYFARNQRQGASAHYFIDDVGDEIYQSVRDCDTAWAVGDWSENLRTISIEVVSAGEDFEGAEIAKTAWLVRRLMDKYGVPASRVIRHYDVSGKRCPAPYIDAGKWARLKARLVEPQNEEEIVTPQDMDKIAGMAADRVWEHWKGRETHDRCYRMTSMLKAMCGIGPEDTTDPIKMADEIQSATIGRVSRMTRMLKAICHVAQSSTEMMDIPDVVEVHLSDEGMEELAARVADKLASARQQGPSEDMR